MPFTTYGLLKGIRSHQIDSPDVADSIAVGRPNACNQCHLDKSMGWAADHLTQWYEIKGPELSRDQQAVSAGVLWATQGDAGQRALMAWSFGWSDAIEASSGQDWVAPFLALLLADSYDAVRYIAGRSLSKLSGFENVAYDFLSPSAQWIQSQQRVLDQWSRGSGARSENSAVLVDSHGKLDFTRFQRLVGQRDNRPFFWPNEAVSRFVRRRRQHGRAAQAITTTSGSNAEVHRRAEVHQRNP